MDHVLPIETGSVRWRMALFGRAADTELYVRNAVIWDGPVYTGTGDDPA